MLAQQVFGIDVCGCNFYIKEKPMQEKVYYFVCRYVTP